MTYSGVGSVVPSMVTPSTSAVSQNATCREAAGAVRLADDGRAVAGRPRTCRGACMVVMSSSFRVWASGTSLTACRVSPASHGRVIHGSVPPGRERRTVGAVPAEESRRGSCRLVRGRCSGGPGRRCPAFRAIPAADPGAARRAGVGAPGEREDSLAPVLDRRVGSGRVRRLGIGAERGARPAATMDLGTRRPARHGYRGRARALADGGARPRRLDGGRAADGRPCLA